MGKRRKQQTLHYEPEADVLSWQMSDEPIDSAKEVGNVVVHYSPSGNPVLLEILEAHTFLNESMALMKRRTAAG